MYKQADKPSTYKGGGGLESLCGLSCGVRANKNNPQPNYLRCLNTALLVRVVIQDVFAKCNIVR